jgi:diguanylate cyclase (GGDEF)-like protein
MSTVILLTTLIFIFDYLMPLGVANGVPYVAVILVGLAMRSPPTVLLLAGLVTLLTIGGLLLSPDPLAPFHVVIINRALALFAIWSTAIVSFVHLRLLLLANRDPLTGAYDQEYFIAKAWEYIKIWRRYRVPFTLIILDVVHLEKINKEYGAMAGDRVLKHIARLLQLHTRTVDMVCRYGSGDEFVILLPMADLAGALEAARRIQQAVSTHRVRWGARMLSPQIRMGVVELLDEQWDLEILMAEAGKALELAKSTAQDQGIAIPQSMAQSPGEEKQNLSPFC